jgi:hypothetical protein
MVGIGRPPRLPMEGDRRGNATRPPGRARGRRLLDGPRDQLRLAMTEVATATREGLPAGRVAVGLRVVGELPDAELTATCGPKHAKRSDRPPGGTAASGSLVLGGRRVPVDRPPGRAPWTAARSSARPRRRSPTTTRWPGWSWSGCFRAGDPPPPPGRRAGRQQGRAACHGDVEVGDLTPVGRPDRQGTGAAAGPRERVLQPAWPPGGHDSP